MRLKAENFVLKSVKSEQKLTKAS